jgi:hypothetical protein
MKCFECYWSFVVQYGMTTLTVTENFHVFEQTRVRLLAGDMVDFARSFMRARGDEIMDINRADSVSVMP